MNKKKPKNNYIYWGSIIGDLVMIIVFGMLAFSTSPLLFIIVLLFIYDLFVVAINKKQSFIGKLGDSLGMIP